MPLTQAVSVITWWRLDREELMIFSERSFTAHS